MKGFFQNRRNCYCAFCRSPRKIYTKKHISFVNIGAAILAVGMLMYFFENLFDPRGAYLLIFFLALAEIFIQIRWRVHLPCRRCGFDPIVYLKDPKKAADRVKETLEKRKSDPSKLLATPLNIPSISKEKAEIIKKAESGHRGVLVSKKI